MTPEEVQKEWHQIALAKCIQPQEYHKGRNDFKSALREHIQKKMDIRDEYDNTYFVLEELKNELDSITPKS